VQPWTYRRRARFQRARDVENVPDPVPSGKPGPTGTMSSVPGTLETCPTASRTRETSCGCLPRLFETDLHLHGSPPIGRTSFSLVSLADNHLDRDRLVGPDNLQADLVSGLAIVDQRLERGEVFDRPPRRI